MATSLPSFPPFEIEGPNVGQRWEKWLKKFENLVIAMDIEEKGTEDQKELKLRQKAMVLHYLGPSAYDIHETLPQHDGYKETCDELNKYFKPKTNTEYEIYMFRKTVQGDETMDQYHTRLRQLASTCGFGDQSDKEIKSQIVFSCRDSSLRKKLLRDSKLTLEQTLELARAMEQSESQAKGIESSDRKEVCFVKKSGTQKPFKNVQNNF